MNTTKKSSLPALLILEGDEIWTYQAPVVYGGPFVPDDCPWLIEKRAMMSKIKLPKFTRIEKPEDQA